MDTQEPLGRFANRFTGFHLVPAFRKLMKPVIGGADTASTEELLAFEPRQC